jgi:hypothetical protein
MITNTGDTIKDNSLVRDKYAYYLESAFTKMVEREAIVNQTPQRYRRSP